jgi:hypothetical protein
MTDFDDEFETPAARDPDELPDPDTIEPTPEEISYFVDCDCEHDSDSHGWVNCDFPGCPCQGHWEE